MQVSVRSYKGEGNEGACGHLQFLLCTPDPVCGSGCALQVQAGRHPCAGSVRGSPSPVPPGPAPGPPRPTALG